MRFPSLLLSAILLPTLGAAELEYRFLPEKGGWHVSANTHMTFPRSTGTKFPRKETAFCSVPNATTRPH